MIQKVVADEEDSEKIGEFQHFIVIVVLSFISRNFVALNNVINKDAN